MPGAFTQPWVAFLGALGGAERKYVSSILGKLDHKRYARIVEPASGGMCVALMARAHGWQAGALDASDVSLYSALIGCSAMGSDLAELDVRLDDEPIAIEGLAPTRQAAVILAEQLIARAEQKQVGKESAYLRAILHDYRTRYDLHVDALALESLPYTAEGDKGKLEIISGHHRIRAAKAAGFESIAVLVDLTKMRRSEIVAKQIAHNQLVGESDPAILRQLTTFIDNPDDFLATGLPDEFLPLPDDDATAGLSTPSPAMVWRTVALSFLPHEFKNFTDLLDALDGHVDLLGVNDVACYDAFAKAVATVSRVRDIRSTGTVVAAMTDAAKLIEDDDAGDDDWVTFPLGRMPEQAAKVVEQAIEKITAADGGAKHRWEALEFICAEFLAS